MNSARYVLRNIKEQGQHVMSAQGGGNDIGQGEGEVNDGKLFSRHKHGSQRVYYWGIGVTLVLHK